MFSSDSNSPPASDAELLHRYQSKPDEVAFRRLVERHLPLVWSTARRLVNGDTALAEDVTQMVFADFAQKAPGLPPDSIAAGWLHRHTCFTARKLVRTEVRRRTREHTAAQLQLDIAMTSEDDPIWLDAAPLVDAALNQLSRPDREALVLRFWQQQDHRSIGTALGSTEEAARKRIARALEKLRTLLRRRGVLLTAALLSQFLTDHATAAVPSSFAATLPGAAWRQAPSGGPITAVSCSLLRRFWPAAAAVLVITGGLWTAARAGWLSPRSSPPGFTIPHSSTKAGTPASPGDILLNFTVVDLPAKHLSLRLLNYQPGEDDEALFADAVKLARAGGSLIEFDLSGPAGRQVSYAKVRPYSYHPQWQWDPVTDRASPLDKEDRTLGTTLKATVEKQPSGLLQLKWQLEHSHSDPEFHAWPVSLEDSGGDPERSIKVEDFHTCSATGQSGNLNPEQPQLLMAQHLDASVLPDGQPEARTLLLFVTLTPP